MGAEQREGYLALRKTLVRFVHRCIMLLVLPSCSGLTQTCKSALPHDVDTKNLVADLAKGVRTSKAE